MKAKPLLFAWLDAGTADGLPLPRYETELAAGMDIAAAVAAPLTIGPGDRALVETNLRVAVPAGFEMQVRPRSGLAARHGITVLNTPGTIDADYRGEIKIILFNSSKISFVVRRGDRIAQLVLAPVARAEIILTDKLDETLRGSGGFGHTGIEPRGE